MTKATVVLEWDEKDLGKGWMNIDNLKLCLYSDQHTLPSLLRVADFKEERNDQSSRTTKETDLEP